MVAKVGAGYIDVFAKLNQSQLGSEIKGKLGAAGAQSGSSFSKAFGEKLKGGLKGAFSSLSGLGIGGGGLGSLLGAASIGGVVAGVKKVADETAKSTLR